MNNDEYSSQNESSRQTDGYGENNINEALNNSEIISESPENTGFEPVGVYSPPFNQPFSPFGVMPEIYREKQRVKYAGLTIGLALVIMLAVSLFWGTAYYFIMGSFGFSADKAYEIINEPALMQVLQIVLSIFMFTLPFIIIYKARGYRISSLVPLSKPKRGNRAALFFFGISFCAFANIAVSYASMLFEGMGIDYNVDYGENPQGLFGFLLTFISTAVVPGLVEEFANRGLIMGSLRKFGDGFAVIVSAILFGIMHGNFEQMPFAFLVGLVLGFIVVKSESLWIAVAVHSFNNFVSVFFDYFLKDVSGFTQNIIYTAFLTVCLLLGLISLSLSKPDADFFRFKKSNMTASVKQRAKWFFTSPLIIVFIVIAFLESIMYFFI